MPTGAAGQDLLLPPGPPSGLPEGPVSAEPAANVRTSGLDHALRRVALFPLFICSPAHCDLPSKLTALVH